MAINTYIPISLCNFCSHL